MTNKKEQIKDFFIKCFYSIIHTEEVVLNSVSSGALTINEVHLISAVFRAKAAGKNTFSIIAKMLGVTLGTLTTSFTRLAKKGYLLRVPHETDKRKFYIVPTDLAEEINKEHIAFHDKMFDGIIGSISEEQLGIVIDSLEKLNDFFIKLRNETTA